MNDFYIIVSALGILCAYAYVAARLSRTVQPIRVQVAEDVEELMSDETIPANLREDLNRLGDSLFSTGSAWLLVLTYPVGVFEALKGRRRGNPRISSHPKGTQISKTFATGVFCMVATSPLCLLVFLLEIAFLMLFFAPLGTAMRSALHLVFRIMGTNPSSNGGDQAVAR